MFSTEEDAFQAGKVERKLGNGNKVVYDGHRHTVSVMKPAGDAWSIIHVPEEGYTLKQFNDYCLRIAVMFATRVFPWSTPAECMKHPALLQS